MANLNLLISAKQIKLGAQHLYVYQLVINDQHTVRLLIASGVLIIIIIIGLFGD